jgi:ribonuclease BN (tRNA processing enzyme)
MGAVGADRVAAQGMELLVLGCHAGMPASGRASSGYLVAAGGCHILLDCGPGVAAALSAHGGAGGLDAIVVTHLHPDHCYDLLPIGIMLRRTARPAPLPLYVPRGGRALLHELGGLFPLGPDPRQDIPFHHAFTVQEYLPGQVIHIGDCTLSMHGLRHVVANCGIRVQSGPDTMAYTGDTGLDGALLELAGGADLLLAEATLAGTDTTGWGHLCATDAAQVATDARVGQLILTHLGSTDPQWALQRKTDATRVFAGPVHLAQAGARYPVRRP